MSSREFLNYIAERSSRAGIDVPLDLALQLEEYYRLLAHWNRHINLTALQLDPVRPESVDRLLIEPLRALGRMATASPIWFDVGSGGGSPAIPLKLALPAGQLTMVESRQRKAAFLREAVRALQLEGTRIEARRMEEVAQDPSLSGFADLMTVRAVRIDPSLFAAAQTVLRFGGQLMLFGARKADLTLPRGFEFSADSTVSPVESIPGLVVISRIGL